MFVGMKNQKSVAAVETRASPGTVLVSTGLLKLLQYKTHVEIYVAESNRERSTNKTQNALLDNSFIHRLSIRINKMVGYPRRIAAHLHSGRKFLHRLGCGARGLEEQTELRPESRRGGGMLGIRHVVSVVD